MYMCLLHLHLYLFDFNYVSKTNTANGKWAAFNITTPKRRMYIHKNISMHLKQWVTNVPMWTIYGPLFVYIIFCRLFGAKPTCDLSESKECSPMDVLFKIVSASPKEMLMDFSDAVSMLAREEINIHKRFTHSAAERYSFCVLISRALPFKFVLK